MRTFFELLNGDGLKVGPDAFTMLKLYVVEIASTLVFIVFVLVEAFKAIKHIIRSAHRRRQSKRRLQFY